MFFLCPHKSIRVISDLSEVIYIYFDISLVANYVYPHFVRGRGSLVKSAAPEHLWLR